MLGLGFYNLPELTALHPIARAVMRNDAYDKIHIIKCRSLGLCIKAVWATMECLTSVENTSMTVLSPDRVSEHGAPVLQNHSSYTKLFQPELLIINWIVHFSESGGHWLWPVVRRNLPPEGTTPGQEYASKRVWWQLTGDSDQNITHHFPSFISVWGYRE